MSPENYEAFKNVTDEIKTIMALMKGVKKLTNDVIGVQLENTLVGELQAKLAFADKLVKER